MKCKSCKRIIEDDSIFCRFCGERQIKQRKAEIDVPTPKQLPSGTWYGRLMVGGNRISISAETEKEYYAKAKAAKAGLIEIEKTKKITLRNAIEKYIAEHEPVASPSTVRGWEIIRKYRFTEYMGKDISTINYQKMISDETGKYSAKTVSNAWGLVRPAIAAFGITPKVALPKRARYNGDFLDYEEIKRFLAAARDDECELAMILALHSLRQSELLDLDVTDIRDGFIHVQGATVQDKNNRFVHKDTNKNETSERKVPVLIPRLTEILPPKGKAVTAHPSTITRHLKTICESANVTPVSLHDLRRSFASLAHHLKWDDRTTMVVGGWSDLSTLKDVYEKISEKDRQRDIKKMKSYYSK